MHHIPEDSSLLSYRFGSPSFHTTELSPGMFIVISWYSIKLGPIGLPGLLVTLHELARVKFRAPAFAATWRVSFYSIWLDLIRFVA
jgi:hypothetical protein